MKSLITILLTLSFNGTQALAALAEDTDRPAEVSCASDLALENSGWVVGSKNFAQDKDANLERFQSDKDQYFVPDLKGVVRSSITGRLVNVTSYDDLRTSHEEMYGDIVFIEDRQTNKLIEIRWYRNGKRHVSYDRSETPCATNLIPFAVNALL